MTSTQRSTLRATSATASRSPRGELVWSTKMALPPMVLMPASKLNRVRRLAFSNISTICFASRAWRYSRGLRLISWPSLRIARTSPLVRSAIEHRSSPARRAAAARISGSFSTGIASGLLSMVALLATLMSSCRRGCGMGRVFRQDCVERSNGRVHISALEDVRGEEAQHRIAGAIDDDAALQHFRNGEFGQVGRVELRGEHESLAAHIDDGLMTLCERA